jgi:hypothetical protein
MSSHNGVLREIPPDAVQLPTEEQLLATAAADMRVQEHQRKMNEAMQENLIRATPAPQFPCDTFRCIHGTLPDGRPIFILEGLRGTYPFRIPAFGAPIVNPETALNIAGELIKWAEEVRAKATTPDAIPASD